jgi:hypothetical protein
MNEAKSRGKIIVFGIVFWYPLAGVTYQFLHYLLGLRRLGYDVYYIEDSGRWVYDPAINDMTPDASRNIQLVAPIFEKYGFGGRWAFRGYYPDGECYGMSESEILSLYREADAFLNVTGAQEIRDEHLACPRRIYVESDPFTSQVGVALGNEKTIATLAAHDMHFSFGENLHAQDCSVPIERFQWLPTRQPVVMDLWDPDNESSSNPAYTTITTWHNEGKDIEYQGETYYWTKDREFMKVIDLPSCCQTPLELALGVEEEVSSMLTKHGWLLVNSVDISRDFDSYRKYIQQSRGEFTVARDQYVRPNTGWFSDRSACYLAAGRPVITQETGFSKYLPTGNGLFGFTTVDDILTAIEAIEKDHRAHCHAAKEIAAEYFAAEKVIGSLMKRAGL